MVKNFVSLIKRVISELATHTDILDDIPIQISQSELKQFN